MAQIKTVLGTVCEEELGIVLPHEHIFCYFEYFYQALGKAYLDKCAVIKKASEHLRFLKDNYGVNTFVDCTPLNIGRDVSVLKEVSSAAGVNIVCSTGFYYTEEILLNHYEENEIYDFLMKDISLSNVGLIKFAAEKKGMSDLLKKIFSVLCELQKNTSLPLCVHTSSREKTAYEILNFTEQKGISPEFITIGHISDSQDPDYILDVAKSGCFLGFDRLHRGREYCERNAKNIAMLCDKGYADKILISHDGLTFSSFEPESVIHDNNPYMPVFDFFIPALLKIGFKESEIKKMMSENPAKMLTPFNR